MIVHVDDKLCSVKFLGVYLYIPECNLHPVFNFIIIFFYIPVANFIYESETFGF